MTRSHAHWRYLISLIAGMLTPLSLAPFDYSLISIFSLMLLACNLYDTNARRTGLHSVCFGLGYFGVGASWVYVSIAQYSVVPAIVAMLATGLFIIVLAIALALPFYGLAAVFKRIYPAGFAGTVFGFALCWTLSEWLRSWLLTGFPWLYIGYSHLQTPLIGWAGVGGVLLVGFCSAFTSSILHYLLRRDTSTTQDINYLLILSSIWVGGALLATHAWTQPSGEPMRIGIVQPNIPQALKWAPEQRQPTRTQLSDMTATLWDNDLIIWPEAAVPEVFHHSLDFLAQTHEQAKANNSAIITGIIYDDAHQQRYFNSVVGLGSAQGIYHKQRLVPFGEYTPLESWFGGLLDFFGFPKSIIAQGEPRQSNIQLLTGQRIATSICYEIAYPALVATQAKDSALLLTISNDAWFGDSIGPKQHFQMTRMRAIETGRYLIRGTNNGISGIISPTGTVIKKGQQFVAETLQAEVTPMTGNTPFMQLKDTLLLWLLLCIGCLFYFWDHPAQQPKATTLQSQDKPPRDELPEDKVLGQP